MAVTVKIEFLYIYLVSYFNMGSRRGPEGKESTHLNNLKSSMRRRLYPIYTGIGGEYGRETFMGETRRIGTAPVFINSIMDGSKKGLEAGWGELTHL